MNDTVDQQVDWQIRAQKLEAKVLEQKDHNDMLARRLEVLKQENKELRQIKVQSKDRHYRKVKLASPFKDGLSFGMGLILGPIVFAVALYMLHMFFGYSFVAK